MAKEIYLDYAATTPTRKEALAEALPYFSKKFGNPSSFHSKGLEAKKALEGARARAAKALDCEPEEIIFTGSGTESIALALEGTALKALHSGKKGVFITQKTEHHAVLGAMEAIKGMGFEVVLLDVDGEGLVDLGALKRELEGRGNGVLLVSIMYANNETGVIQPIGEIAKMCREKGVLFHTDACQGAEYLDISTKRLGTDMMTLNGSKIYAFKGTGLLYKRKGVQIEPLIRGGGHEFGLRAGTENVPGIVALAKALELAQKEKKAEAKRLRKLRDYFIARVEKEVPNARLNGHRTKRLPNNANISFEGVEGESILLRLNEKGIRVSTGSACTSQSLDPSHVLLAMGIPHGTAHGSIRFTFGKFTTKSDLDFTIKQLKEIVAFLRMISPVWEKAEWKRKIRERKR